MVSILLILLPFYVIGKNPVKFVFDSEKLYNLKISAITGNILDNIVDPDIWESFFKSKARFKLILKVDINGNIVLLKNMSIGVSDSIIDKFINVVKKENIDFYVYLGEDVKNKKSYIIDHLQGKLHSPYLVMFFFPGEILYGKREFKSILYMTKPIPSKEKIRELCRKYMNIHLKTYSLNEISKDFDIRMLQQ